MLQKRRASANQLVTVLTQVLLRKRHNERLCELSTKVQGKPKNNHIRKTKNSRIETDDWCKLYFATSTAQYFYD